MAFDCFDKNDTKHGVRSVKPLQAFRSLYKVPLQADIWSLFLLS